MRIILYTGGGGGGGGAERRGGERGGGRGKGVYRVTNIMICTMHAHYDNCNWLAT